jgi:hypothetical protein
MTPARVPTPPSNMHTPLHRSTLAPSLLLATVAFVGLSLGASPLAAQVPGISREQMWPAPTAEDWARPCLITWQRSFPEALAVAKETGKPILIAVNMDGEIASEHYAGIRYRQPEIAALYEPYVCVIASVYRHNPRDYDDEGRRIPCPRFGTVTCGEHIWIEPGLFEQFFEGQRIAPRHIGLRLDEAEMYDVFYAFDTDSVFAAIREGAAGWPEPLPSVDLGDRDILERVASPDVTDQIAVEQAYEEGDRTRRRALLQAARSAGGDAPVDMLRLALFDLDVELNQLALLALAEAKQESAIGLIGEALRIPMDPEMREALIAALERLGEIYPKARTLAAVHRGLAARSKALDAESWATALAGAGEPAVESDRLILEYRLENQTRASVTHQEDATALLELAEASLALAIHPETAAILAPDSRTRTRYARLMFEDVRRAARRAEELGATSWRVDAVLALAAYYLEDRDTADARAEAAVGALPAGEESWNAMAVLALFAQARQKAVFRAVRSKEEWPGEWLTDVNAAYSILARHPLGAPEYVISHHDFLRYLGAGGAAARVLDEGLLRFPDSPLLHAGLRSRILREKGVDGLLSVYDEMRGAPGEHPDLEWYAGYAAIVAAEFHRRAASGEEALAAYETAIACYGRCAEENRESQGNVDHYVAIAIAGRARLALEREEYETALAELLASFARKPEAAATLDGLGLSAVATAQTLLARLREGERSDLIAQLQAALDGLDPALLELPAFERDGPRGRRGNRSGRRDRGGRGR